MDSGFARLRVRPGMTTFSLRQRRVGLQDAVRAGGDVHLQPGRLNRDVLGEEASQRRAAGIVAAVTQRRERLFGEQAAAGGVAEQPQVWRGAGKRSLRAFLRQQPLRRALEAVDCLSKPRRGFAESRCVTRLYRGDRRAQLVEIERDGLPVLPAAPCG